MTPEYEKFVMDCVILANDNPRERILLGALGLGGESGEVIDLVKKHIMHGKRELDIRDDLLYEMGDVLWYFTLLMVMYNFDLNEIIEANIKKLTARDDSHYQPDTDKKS